MGDTLFPVPEGAHAEKPAGSKRPSARLVYADRRQILLRPSDLESLLPADHRARVVWGFVSKLDLSAFHERIASREGAAGRPSFDPAVVLTLWIFATLEGVGSARALARLCEEHDAYRWVCGGLTISAHVLSDFRVDRGAELDALMTQIVGSLLAAGAVTMERVAQDGMKVRAAAGAASFRRKETLKRCLTEAREQVEALKKELDDAPDAGERRSRLAKERAAKDLERRVTDALAQWDEAAAHSSAPKDKKDEKVRVSTTDADARVMKMGDGGFRPALNAQLSTDVKSQVITGLRLTNSGGDMGQMPPMLEDLQRRYGRVPAQYLVDGGFVKHQAIEDAAAKGVAVYAPVPEKGAASPERQNDGAGQKAWRARMTTPEAKEIYKERAATAECVNALARNRGLTCFVVRGIAKCTAVLTLFAVAHNVMRAVELLGRAG